MEPRQACKNILNQLTDLVEHIKPTDFSQPVATLNHSTIGQHLRHTLEFFICFERGFEHGIINYDKRAHDKLIESDKYIALAAIQRIKEFIQQPHHDKGLILEVSYDLSADDFITIETNFMRELVYNIEHAVHHMAIMKIGIKEVAHYITLPSDFGVAASTIRHKEAENKALL
ncbi:DinB family protein [Chryseotalea sanaruensis]|uniref:DinB family protein n=1 Tax=Chryseotalea sanaruensis TaxID=2482724 RepID=A0A401U8I1_9BACT|nr:DinB family protein [Chryseotalea sanaruensis]GCC51189.1 DinB family protein [Chryseotalea sanaruensis]